MQFLLLPIRDWNMKIEGVVEIRKDCNFYYSLLGIETIKSGLVYSYLLPLQFLLLPIRDWNHISITPY